MTDRELMQQALEAMGNVGADCICEESHHAKKDQHKWGEPCPLQQRWHIAYQALRERLAQPDTKVNSEAIPKQISEPVAWRWKERINNDFDSWVVTSSGPVPYATEVQPLYTTPPRREWVGLTDVDYAGIPLHWIGLAEWVEAKLREKNT